LNDLSICTHVICLLTGTAIRHCSDEKGWLPPELFNCTSLSFSKLKKEVCDSFVGWFNLELFCHNPRSDQCDFICDSEWGSSC